MQSSTFWKRALSQKCLAESPRLSLHSQKPVNHVLPFSTTASVALPAPKQKSNSRAGTPTRGVKQLRIKKNRTVETLRRPAPGERKALRKRIVLSNTNALEVEGLPELSAENMLDAGLHGQMSTLPGAVVDSLRAVEAFKATQGWGFFRRPAALIRSETLEMARLIDEVERSEDKQTVRRAVVGERGSGKSTLVLQAMAMAFLKGWVVVNIPDAKDLTIGYTDYAPLKDSNPVQYIQPTYTSNLLSQIAKANANVLSSLELTPNHSHDLPIPIQSNITLQRLATLGAQDPSISWPIFLALWTELTAPSRPPLFLALDGIHHLMRPTANLAPDCTPIHAHDLALIAHLLPYLAGRKPLPNGGLFLAATSESNRPIVPSLDYAIAQSEARSAGIGSGGGDGGEAASSSSLSSSPFFAVKEDGTPIDTRAGPLLRTLDSYTRIPPPPPLFPQPDPYASRDVRVLDIMSSVPILRLRGLSRDEARAVLEYYAASGMMRGVVNERALSEKWTLAGGGVVGELERAAVRMRI